MEFKKEGDEHMIVKLRELTKRGFTYSYLRSVYFRPNQKCMWKQHPNKKNSPILVDTELFQKMIERDVELSKEPYAF